MAAQAKRSGGFAVRDEALATYVRTSGRIATELAGFGQHELGTVRTLPADAFGPLAHTVGFTEAVVRFAHLATDSAHAIGATVHNIESTVDEMVHRYRAAERSVAATMDAAGRGATA
jgi:hypothetical protein